MIFLLALAAATPITPMEDAPAPAPMSQAHVDALTTALTNAGGDCAAIASASMVWGTLDDPGPTDVPADLTALHTALTTARKACPLHKEAKTALTQLGARVPEAPLWPIRIASERLAVDILEPTTDGGITSDSFAPQMARHTGNMLECYEKMDDRFPELGGTLTVAASVIPSGEVSDVVISDSTLEARPLDFCIRARFQQMVLDPIESGESATLVVPLAFIRL
jgi:hypothetical protein